MVEVHADKTVSPLSVLLDVESPSVAILDLSLTHANHVVSVDTAAFKWLLLPDWRVPGRSFLSLVGPLAEGLDRSELWSANSAKL